MTTAAIPTVRGLPVVGNLWAFRNDRLNFLVQAARECGDIGRIALGPHGLILVNAAHHIHTIFVEHAYDVEKTPFARNSLWPLIGDGLLLSEQATHKRQRKLVAPAFQHRRIAAYADVMTHYTDRLAAQWTDGMQIDVAHAMMRLTLEIVAKTLFDADVSQEADTIGSALTTALHQMEVAPSILPLPGFYRRMRTARLRAAINHLDAIVLGIIEERRQAGDDRGDLLSMLLQAQDADDGTAMSPQQVRDEAMTLFLAGHETTANALAWTWYLLTQHPAVYTQLCNEVDTVLGGRTPTFADLAQLPYTLRVFKEGLRLYPPAYATSRVVVRPFALGDHHLPEGTVLFISPYTLHRRPDYFADPERFDPDRWSPECEAQLPRHAYLPFGAGARVCIGNQFALMEGQLVLATLAQRVRFELVPGQRIEAEPLITLRPKHGIQVRVRRRMHMVG